MIEDRDDTAALAAYLAANPHMSPRDFKGKGFTIYNPFDKYHVAEGEVEWDKLNPADVRKAALSDKARFLSRAQRQAAGRDPSLVWEERTRSYVLRSDAVPAPQAPTSAGEADAAPPPSESFEPPASRPAGATSLNANPIFWTQPRARARSGD